MPRGIYPRKPAATSKRNGKSDRRVSEVTAQLTAELQTTIEQLVREYAERMVRAAVADAMAALERSVR